jgi:hypothetical protein
MNPGVVRLRKYSDNTVVFRKEFRGYTQGNYTPQTNMKLWGQIVCEKGNAEMGWGPVK